MFSVIISLIGNAYYGLAPSIPDSKWQIFAARFLVGFSLGIIALCRNYIIEVSRIETITKNLTYATSAQGVGTISLIFFYILLII